MPIDRETVLRLACEVFNYAYDLDSRSFESIETFANLIAAEQKERDAKICEEFKHPLVCLTIDGRARLVAEIRKEVK